jgi:4-hydroxy-tetrahydrodipicolinate synthase
MWKGVIPAVTTKFKEDGSLDLDENLRSFSLQIEAGCDGLIIGGSLGEGSMLSHDERLQLIIPARQAAGKRPVLLTVNEAATSEAVSLAKRAAKAGADGIMVVPSPIYHTDHRETVAVLRAIAQAADLPVMIYSNRIAYRVDITPEILEDLADDSRFVAVKESSDDVRRVTEIFNRLGHRYDVFTGVDNLAYEALAVGADGWVAGLCCAFPHETVTVYRLMMAGRWKEALELYSWFRPLLDLDVSTFLVQNIKLAEAIALNSNDRVRPPRLPHAGETRAKIERLVRDAIATRPALAKVA